MYTQLIDFGSPQFDEALLLRDQILRKPLGLEFKEEDIAKEYDSYHLGCYNDFHELIACLVLLPLSETEIKMRQVAVDSSLQRQGIGVFLVKSSEILARDLGYSLMSLNARDVAVDFYLKLNYKTVGDPFEEVSIQHFRMVKAL